MLSELIAPRSANAATTRRACRSPLPTVAATLPRGNSLRYNSVSRWRYLGPGALIEDNSVRSHSSLTTNLRLGRMLAARSELPRDVFNLFVVAWQETGQSLPLEFALFPAPIHVQADFGRPLVVVSMMNIGRMGVVTSEPRMHMPMRVRFAAIPRCVVLVLSGIPTALQ